MLNAELMRQGSVGLPLQDEQIQPGQLVSLVIGQQVLAWGELVPSDAPWSVPGVAGSIKITPAYTVIRLTNLFIPGFLVSKHKQTLQWLLDHGGHAVVQKRTLQTRAADAPLPVSEDLSLGVPAPVNIPLSYPELPQVMPTTATQVSDEQPEDPEIHSDLDLDDDEPEPTEDDCEATVINAIRHAQDIICQAADSLDPLVTRVLDDAYHFMDRLLRLLSKRHSPFKEFAHQFSETIFIRDQDDENKVRDVLKKKGISWDYAVRAKKAALHRRIRRYIPDAKHLANSLQILFHGFEDLQDSVDRKAGHGTPLARKQANTLLKTVQLGFLSDPPNIALYYLLGTDHDGLNLYRTPILASLDGDPDPVCGPLCTPHSAAAVRAQSPDVYVLSDSDDDFPEAEALIDQLVRDGLPPLIRTNPGAESRIIVTRSVRRQQWQDEAAATAMPVSRTVLFIPGPLLTSAMDLTRTSNKVRRVKLMLLT
ncbi:hypothetical protein B0H10DRAFT_2235691 [Mycena sp. CBHHK59/15]|nr:hypothetical protein B0H10DRAFT_2235691 [Mycena sp. CBHHK59/15]